MFHSHLTGVALWTPALFVLWHMVDPHIYLDIHPPSVTMKDSKAGLEWICLSYVGLLPEQQCQAQFSPWPFQLKDMYAHTQP